MASLNSANIDCNTTIILSGIPAEQNKTVDLCNHFCKFGKIKTVVTPYDGNSNAAAIIFDTKSEASAAFNSSEPVLNNRSIKMSWNLLPQQPSTSSSSSAAPVQNDDTKCTLCDKDFASQWHRDQHVKRFHSGTGYKCNACNASFASENMYKKHNAVHHSNASTKAAGSSQANVKFENAEQKFDVSLVEKNVLMRIRIKVLKKTIKRNRKAYAKSLKLMEKKNKALEDQLKGLLIILTVFKLKIIITLVITRNVIFFSEKENLLLEKDKILLEKQSDLTNLHQMNGTLQAQNAKFKQDLLNGQQALGMLRETLAVVVNLNHCE